MIFVQKKVSLAARSRGMHLVTDEIVRAVPEIREMAMGTCHLFLQHTSAGLTLNENCDPDVRSDLAMVLDTVVPETLPFEHVDEGSDDMPAHAKSTLTGVSLTVPITQGKLALGTWQGVYLCEFRNRGGPRRLVVTINGVKN
jgi:secondary thiamine-phosphate synthase enzyme